MRLHGLIGERDQLLLPIDSRIEVIEPGHPEDDVIANEREDDERYLIGVRADANRSEFDDSERRVSSPISESDEIRLRGR